jgi:glucosylceramidase
MALSPNDLSTWGWQQNCMITVDQKPIYNYEYFVMKHFSRFVQKGAKRLGLTGHFTGTSVSFKNPDKSVVLISQNPFNRQHAFIFDGKTITLPPDSINTIVFC